MGFQSVDELEKFSFEDCRIISFEVTEDGLFFRVEALIVKPENSQNSNYTESYAGETQIRLSGARIEEAFQEGYRYYDANDVLQQEYPDKELAKEELVALPGKCEGAYLFAVEKREELEGRKHYAIGIELAKEDSFDTEVTETYQLNVTFEKAIVNWEQYLNRVQR